MIFLPPYVYVEITWNLKLQCYLEARKPSRLINCLKILNQYNEKSMTISVFVIFQNSNFTIAQSGFVWLHFRVNLFFFAFVAHSKYISVKFTNHFRNISSQKKLFFINYFHLY